jgi:hypothetical protein
MRRTFLSGLFCPLKGSSFLKRKQSESDMDAFVRVACTAHVARLDSGETLSDAPDLMLLSEDERQRQARLERDHND